MRPLPDRKKRPPPRGGNGGPQRKDGSETTYGTVGGPGQQDLASVFGNPELARYIHAELPRLLDPVERQGRLEEVAERAEQRQGCPHYLTHPDLVPGEQIDWVEYRMADGAIWRDGFSPEQAEPAA